MSIRLLDVCSPSSHTPLNVRSDRRRVFETESIRPARRSVPGDRVGVDTDDRQYERDADKNAHQSHADAGRLGEATGDATVDTVKSAMEAGLANGIE